MKKMTYKNKMWHIIRARKQLRNKRRGQKVDYAEWVSTIIGSLSSDEIQNEFVPLLAKYGKRIVPPEDFCLNRNFDEVASFLESTRSNNSRSIRMVRKWGKTKQLAKIARRASWIDFRNIDYISTSAALLLASELDRIRRFKKSPTFPIFIDEWKPDVRKTLVELGYLDIFGIEYKSSELFEKESFSIKKFTTGKDVDPSVADRLVSEIDDLTGSLSDKIIQINGAIGEAMGNVVGHAYPDWHSFEHPTTRQWWLTGSFDSETGEVCITLYDQGVTIPVHFPKDKSQTFLESLLPFRERDGDAEMIVRASHSGRTSTGEKGRGKGFGDMMSAIDSCEQGRLRVLSRRGEFIYSKGQKPVCYNHGSSIGGTLIEWNICVPKEKTAHQ